MFEALFHISSSWTLRVDSICHFIMLREAFERRSIFIVEIWPEDIFLNCTFIWLWSKHWIGWKFPLTCQQNQIKFKTHLSFKEYNEKGTMLESLNQLIILLFIWLNTNVNFMSKRCFSQSSVICIILNFCDYDYYFFKFDNYNSQGISVEGSFTCFLWFNSLLQCAIFNFSTACFLHAIQTVTNLIFLTAQYLKIRKVLIKTLSQNIEFLHFITIISE